MFSLAGRCAAAAVLVVGLVLLPAGGGLKPGDDGQQGQNNDGQKNQKDDGQQNQKDDGQQNQKDDGQQNQRDDGQQNQNDDGRQNQKDDGRQNQAVVKEVNLAGDGLVVTVRRGEKDVEQTLGLAKNVRVVLGGKPGELADLKAGMRVALFLSKDKKVVRIKGE